MHSKHTHILCKQKLLFWMRLLFDNTNNDLFMISKFHTTATVANIWNGSKSSKLS